MPCCYSCILPVPHCKQIPLVHLEIQPKFCFSSLRNPTPPTLLSVTFSFVYDLRGRVSKWHVCVNVKEALETQAQTATPPEKVRPVAELLKMHTTTVCI